MSKIEAYSVGIIFMAFSMLFVVPNASEWLGVEAWFASVSMAGIFLGSLFARLREVRQRSIIALYAGLLFSGLCVMMMGRDAVLLFVFGVPAGVGCMVAQIVMIGKRKTEEIVVITGLASFIFSSILAVAISDNNLSTSEVIIHHLSFHLCVMVASYFIVDKIVTEPEVLATT